MLPAGLISGLHLSSRAAAAEYLQQHVASSEHPLALWSSDGEVKAGSSQGQAVVNTLSSLPCLLRGLQISRGLQLHFRGLACTSGCLT